MESHHIQEMLAAQNVSREMKYNHITLITRELLIMEREKHQNKKKVLYLKKKWHFLPWKSRYHKTLKKKSVVKITNPHNGKYLIANVKSNKIKFSDFYNSILSLRISKELELDINEPYVEIVLVSKNSTFIAKKAKMFEEEKSVAEKAPVDGIQINDLNVKKVKKKITK